MSSLPYRQKGIQVAMDMIYGASLRKLSLFIFDDENGEAVVNAYKSTVAAKIKEEKFERSRDSLCWNQEEETQKRMVRYLGAPMNSQQAKDFAAGFYSVVDAVLKE